MPDFENYPILNAIYLDELELVDLRIIKDNFIVIAADFIKIQEEFQVNKDNLIFLSKTFHKFKSSFYLSGAKKFGGLLEYLQNNPHEYNTYKNLIPKLFEEFKSSILTYFTEHQVK